MLLGPVIAGCGATSSNEAPATADLIAVEVGATTGPSTDSPAETLCRWDGPLTGALRTPSGVEFAQATSAPTRATLVRRDGALRLELETDVDGVHVRGWSNPREDFGLRFVADGWHVDGVAVREGAGATITNAREGEVEVEPRMVESEIHLVVPASRWLSCDALRLDRHREADEQAFAPRAELGVARRTLELGVRTPVPLAHAPSERPFAELGPGEPMTVEVLDETPTHLRLMRVSSVTLIVGWAERGAIHTLTRTGDSGDGFALGATADVGWCMSASRLAIEVETTTRREVVGWIEPGAHFYRREVRADGASAIDTLSWQLGPSRGSNWLVTVPDDPTCHDGVPPRGAGPSPMGRLSSLAWTLQRTFPATVTSSNVASIANGSSCSLRLTHPESGSGACNATLRCSGRSLYANDALACEVTGYDSVVAQDAATSRIDQDPGFGLDLARGVVLMTDDDSGNLGSMRVTLQLGPESR